MATLRRNPKYWAYASNMLARFCNDGYRMVVGVEQTNEHATMEYASVFLRGAAESFLQPNRREHRARHHDLKRR
ncbi:hypothetical protein Slin15195_G040810 [Septoria linicola]|uniref:Uncharacterized protein n=1 Tax=Septoria linicola TaxID=215465 RepID=A0A9Q9EI86_9PEZI|nr:hypothetical protein Slin14017_G044340 [Septoria linicola]USW50762.1 hypothetical protein Slin15195_G040810 [Septoria linicola]